MAGTLILENVVLTSVHYQCFSKTLPLGDGKAKPQKERGFATPDRMRWVEQIAGNFLLWHESQVRIGQFHFAAFVEAPWRCSLRKEYTDVPPYLLLYLVHATAGLDDSEAGGVGLGQDQVSGADGGVEVGGHLLHAVGGADGAGATEEAAVGFLGSYVEEEGEGGAEGAYGEIVDEGYGCAVETAGDALVNGGGIHEAVGDYPTAGVQGGLDDAADQLGTAGGEEEEFGLGGHVTALVREL
jgi:hypothetical protein